MFHLNVNYKDVGYGVSTTFEFNTKNEMYSAFGALTEDHIIHSVTFDTDSITCLISKKIEVKEDD